MAFWSAEHGAWTSGSPACDRTHARETLPARHRPLTPLSRTLARQPPTMPRTPIIRASDLTDFLVDRRGTIVILVLLASALLLTQIPRVEFDSTLRAFYESDSQEYERYKRFAERFGSDEFVPDRHQVSRGGQQPRDRIIGTRS